MGETAEKTMPKKHISPALTAILIVLAAGMVCSICLSAYLMRQVRSLQGYDDSDYYDQSMEPTQENDVTIAGEYVIRSTEQISDAYLSGDSSSLSDTDKETLQMASDVLDAITTDSMTDFEKEKAVYDWMCANISIDDGSMTVIPTTEDGVDCPHGVLKSHKAICVGYATTFRLFMQMMGINCMVEHNTECYHSWDLVQLDGDWYITDVYSDASVGSYSRFNINDALMMSYGETWDTEYFPAATSLTYNVAYRNAEESDNVYDLPAALRAALDNRVSLYSVRYSNLSVADKTVAESMVSTVMSMLWNVTSFGNVSMDYNWTSDDNSETMLIVNLRWENYSDDDNTFSMLTDEQQQKANDAMNTAFGDVLVSVSAVG